VYALKVDIDAIEATASTLLADGKGIDRDVMSQHMLSIQRQGMGKALSQFSERMRSTTLHPRPQHVLLPPLRHPPLPVRPHPALVQHLTAEQKRLRDDHVARISVPPPREPLIPIEVTALTQKTLGPFNLSMRFDERLNALAVEGGPLLVGDNFVPNNGEGVRSYPSDVAPRGAIEVHMVANQRKGRVVVLPLGFAREACASADIPFHVSSCMVGQKQDADPR